MEFCTAVEVFLLRGVAILHVHGFEEYLGVVWSMGCLSKRCTFAWLLKWVVVFQGDTCSGLNNGTSEASIRLGQTPIQTSALNPKMLYGL